MIPTLAHCKEDTTSRFTKCINQPHCYHCQQVCDVGPLDAPSCQF